METSFTTDRLLIRLAERREAGMILDFYQRNFDEFSRFEYLDARSCKNLKYFQALVDADQEAFRNKRTFRFYVYELDNPLKIIGTASFRDLKFGCRMSCEIGYKIDKDCRRRGYATDILTLLIYRIHNEFGIHRFEATVREDNTPSMELLDTLGFLWEGTLREYAYLEDQWWDHYLYTKIMQ